MHFQKKNKKALLKKEEIKIRQSIGEAVPTNVFFQIAENIKKFLWNKSILQLQL